MAKAIANMATQLGQSINNNNVAFVILNQARDDLGAPGNIPMIKSTGGKAMEHWASLRLEVAKASQIKGKVFNPVTGKDEDNTYIGHIFRVKTKKSKVSTPNRKAEMFLISEPFIGFDIPENVYRTSTEQYGLISKSAGWRAYTTDDGHEVKMREQDFIDFLGTEEGKPVLHELLRKQMERLYPNDYVGLHNTHVDITNNEFYKELAEYYKSKPKEEETEEATE